MYMCLMNIMKSQNKIGVDILLLPSDEMMDNAIEVNQALACVRITYRDVGWIWDNPTEAALEFAAENIEFIIEQPGWAFSESELTENITHWPGAYLKRVE